jgi:hypothetical protein
MLPMGKTRMTHPANFPVQGPITRPVSHARNNLYEMTQAFL